MLKITSIRRRCICMGYHVPPTCKRSHTLLYNHYIPAYVDCSEGRGVLEIQIYDFETTADPKGPASKPNFWLDLEAPTLWFPHGGQANFPAKMCPKNQNQNINIYLRFLMTSRRILVSWAPMKNFSPV